MNPKILPVLVVSLLLCSSALCDDSNDQRGAAILEQARSVYQLTVAQPFHVSAQVVLLAGEKKVAGTYTYTSNGSILRDEVAVPGYQEVRLRIGSEEKIQRPIAYSPLAIYSAFDSMRRPGSLQLLADERVVRVRNQKIAKVPAKCLEIEEKLGKRTVCVYDDGTLAALSLSAGWNYEYSEYTSFEKAHIPGRVRVSENGSDVVELRFSTVEALPDGYNVRDDVGQASAVVGWCAAMIPPSLSKGVQPQYPKGARESHTQGTVDIYGTIQPDGHFKDLSVVRSAGALLDRASLDAVSQWIYQPATCGGVPIARETVVSVHYELGYR